MVRRRRDGYALDVVQMVDVWGADDVQDQTYEAQADNRARILSSHMRGKETRSKTF